MLAQAGGTKVCEGQFTFNPVTHHIATENDMTFMNSSALINKLLLHQIQKDVDTFRIPNDKVHKSISAFFMYLQNYFKLSRVS